MKITIDTRTRTISIDTGVFRTNNMVDRNGRPHVPEGTSKGGQFAPKGGSSGGAKSVIKQSPKIVKTKQGNIVDITDCFNKKPSLRDVKDYINKAFIKSQPYATLSPDWKIDLKGNAKNRKHVVYSERWEHLTTAEKNRHNQYVMLFDSLVTNAKYSHSKANTKKEQKPNVVKYHYFTTTVQIDKDMYKVVLDTEERVGDSTKKPQTVHLYNIKEITALDADQN